MPACLTYFSAAASLTLIASLSATCYGAFYPKVCTLSAITSVHRHHLCSRMQTFMEYSVYIVNCQNQLLLMLCLSSNFILKFKLHLGSTLECNPYHIVFILNFTAILGALWNAHCSISMFILSFTAILGTLWNAIWPCHTGYCSLTEEAPCNSLFVANSGFALPLKYLWSALGVCLCLCFVCVGVFCMLFWKWKIRLELQPHIQSLVIAFLASFQEWNPQRLWKRVNSLGVHLPASYSILGTCPSRKHPWGCSSLGDYSPIISRHTILSHVCSTLGTYLSSKHPWGCRSLGAYSPIISWHTIQSFVYYVWVHHPLVCVPPPTSIPPTVVRRGLPLRLPAARKLVRTHIWGDGKNFWPLPSHLQGVHLEVGVMEVIVGGMVTGIVVVAVAAWEYLQDECQWVVWLLPLIPKHALSFAKNYECRLML